jgi:phosphatidylethanolamine-binding protein (PEBP) family uncharacterized protein
MIPMRPLARGFIGFCMTSPRPPPICPKRCLRADALLGAKQGLNDFKHLGYGGPYPPPGTAHRYFQTYALDRVIDLKPGATKKELEAAMEKHMAEGQLIGIYKRK